jgi:hypothetical protein
MVTALTLPMMQQLFGATNPSPGSPGNPETTATLQRPRGPSLTAAPAGLMSLTKESLERFQESMQHQPGQRLAPSAPKQLLGSPQNKDDDSSSGDSMITALTSQMITSRRAASGVPPATSVTQRLAAARRTSPELKPQLPVSTDGIGLPPRTLGSGNTTPLGRASPLNVDKFTSAPIGKTQQVHIRRFGAAEGVTSAVDYDTMKKAIREMKKELYERKNSTDKGGTLDTVDWAMKLGQKLAPGARLNASKFQSAPMQQKVAANNPESSAARQTSGTIDLGLPLSGGSDSE